MAFQQGLSGLNAASKTMETIGNNVANAGTVGFKKSQAQFADVYASSLIGSGASPIGIGTKLARVAQQFSQANISGTSNPLDMAINGDGFFRMSTGGAITYTRNGQFLLNKDGNIENANGALLTGYPVDSNGQISNGAPEALRITNTALAPQATSRYDVNLNLDSGKTAITAPFNPGDPLTYSNQTSVGVYDSLGNSHVLSTFYVNRGDVPGPGNSWDVYATISSPDNPTPVPVNLADPSIPAVLAAADAPVAGFTGTGIKIPFSQGGLPLASIPPVDATLNLTNGAATPQAVSINFAGTTQYALDFGVRDQTQDGYTAGNLVSFNLSPDGRIVGSYTNGQTNVLGQVALASFANPNGLTPQGDNQWVETAVSGPPLVSTPGGSGLGVVQSAAVEESNVDLTAELVAMITAQRIYQANAQTIKTEDQIMQTLVNLR